MNDLEICKRMGEIESLNGDFGTHLNGAHGRRYIDGSFKYYNPLTDDALCFKLMIKHGVERRILDGIVYYSIPFKSSMYQAEPDCDSTAVSLAIIEAHKCS